jgi:hypothetical protein
LFETLYKTNAPQEIERAEYYQPHLDAQLVHGKTVYFVREKHGWYDDRMKRVFHSTATLDPEEGFPAYEKAEARYKKQVRYRASAGFIHSFIFDPFGDPPFKYRLIRTRRRL